MEDNTTPEEDSASSDMEEEEAQDNGHHDDDEMDMTQSFYHADASLLKFIVDRVNPGTEVCRL